MSKIGLIIIFFISLPSFGQIKTYDYKLWLKLDEFCGNYVIDNNKENITNLNIKNDSTFVIVKDKKEITGIWRTKHDTINLIPEYGFDLKLLIKNYDSLETISSNPKLIFNKQIGYYANGKKSGIIKYKYNKGAYIRNGLEIRYYKNGERLSKVRYVKGKRQGRYKEYYDYELQRSFIFHKIQRKGRFKNDLMHGRWVEKGPTRYGVWYFKNGIQQGDPKRLLLLNVVF